jgi:hypothetical protein
MPQSRALGRRASPGPAGGQIHRERRAGTGRCACERPIPLGTAGDPPRRQRLSGIAPRRSFAKSFITIAETGARVFSCTDRARPVVGRCGSALTPWNRYR